MNAVHELLNSHRSIRKFTDQPISDELLTTILRSGQAAATSSFLQGATVIRVRNPASREKLAAFAGNQPYVSSAAEFFVLCADLKRPGNCCVQYDKPFEGDYTEHFIIATVDVALMAQNMVVAAEAAGLGICYIGGLRNNPRDVSDLLQLPKGVYPVFGLCLGYPDQDPECKPRLRSALRNTTNEYVNTTNNARAGGMASRGASKLRPCSARRRARICASSSPTKASR